MRLSRLLLLLLERTNHYLTFLHALTLFVLFVLVGLHVRLQVLLDLLDVVDLGLLLLEQVPGLLKLIVAIVENLGELEWNLRVALARESVENFGKISLSDDGILDLAYLLV